MMLLLLMLCAVMSSLHAAPLARRLVDLTYTFDETTLHYPTVKAFQMDVVWNGTIGEEKLWWLQTEEYLSSTHAGTHMDAPAHFSKGGLTVEQIPVSHLMAPAAVVDITAKAELNSDAEVTTEDLLHWESVTGQSLNEVILLIRTGWGRFWSNQTAYTGTSDNDTAKLHSPGMAGDAAQWLVDNRNIYGIGIDTLSFDVGSTRTAASHLILLGHGIYGLENLAKLEELPICGAKLYVMPMKIGKASGAPTRVVATFPEVMFG